MSSFRVGQRVRIVRNVGPDLWRSIVDKLIGTESVVLFIHSAEQRVPGHQIVLAGLKSFLFHPDDLEPIVPEGHRPAENDIHERLPFLKEMEKVS